MLVPMIVLAADPKPDVARKETINSYRVFAKEGQEAALKAALAAHAQKFHGGAWKWHVSLVLSGPDEGAYMIVEGPNSWTELENRGDLGAEHQKDFDENVSPHIERSTPEAYLTLEPQASTVAADAWSPTKTLVRYYYAKPGRSPRLLESMKLLKRVWQKRGQNVVVWSTYFSGEPAYILAVRLKNGWKDLDADVMDIRKAADETIGAGAYDRILDEISVDASRVVDEMLESKPELSSK